MARTKLHLKIPVFNWHLSFFLSFFLSSFRSFFLSIFLSQSSLFSLLSVGVEVIVAIDHTQWHAHTHSNTHTHTHTYTLGRIPLDEWSVRRRDLYLTTHNTRNRQTRWPPAEFEPAVPASERPQNNALDRAATGIGVEWTLTNKLSFYN
jgi:hypothetical protein